MICIQGAFSEDIKPKNEVKKKNETQGKTKEKKPEEKKLTFRAKEAYLKRRAS